ncbi:MAG: hypothetical protein GXX96_36465 [Planctomycetaceae bacterium]|nr:hypothetical protein [Planctomycetaceae bacterium]
MDLIECGDHQFAPGIVVCKHLVDGDSKRWCRVRSGEQEFDDWVCPECFRRIWAVGVEDLRSVCIHCAEQLRAEGEEVPDEIAELEAWGQERSRSLGYQEWRTRFDEAGDLFPDTKRLPLSARLPMEVERLSQLERAEASKTEAERLCEEYLWLLANKPYYRVHPRIVPYLCRCRLDTIPSSYVEVPGGFHTVDIRFSQPHPDLTVEGDEYVRNILLAKPVMPRLSETERLSFLAEGRIPQGLNARTDSLCLHVDLGDQAHCGSIYYIRDWVFMIRLSPENSLEDAFEAVENVAATPIGPGSRRREVLKNCLRIVATIGFMANTPEGNFLQYDVLSKDRLKFEQGDDETKKRLIDRARRRGKHGWNVGTNEMFLGETPRWSGSGSGEHGRGHSHAHIRSGHLHAVRCGEGRKNVKIKWFRPTVVRPDLRFS